MKSPVVRTLVHSQLAFLGALVLALTTAFPADAQTGDDSPRDGDAASDDAADDEALGDAAPEDGIAADDDDASLDDDGDDDGADDGAPAAAAPVPADAAAARPPGAGAETSSADTLAAPTVATGAAGAGGGTPDDDDDDEEESFVEEANEEASQPAGPAQPVTHNWRNSFFFWTQNVSAYTFAPEGQLTYNPTYSWDLAVQPRWYIGPSLFFRLTQSASVEWTDTDLRVRNREFVLNDTQLTLLEGNLASIAGITFSVGANVFVPTSIASQNNTMIIGAGGFGLARYSFPQVLNGLIVIGSAGYTYRHFDQNVGRFDGGDDAPVNVGFNASGQPINAPLNSGNANQSHSLGVGLSATLVATSNFFVSGSFSWGRGWAQNLAEACFNDESASADTACIPATNGNEVRDSTFFSIGGSYQFTKWLNVGLSMGTSRVYFIDSIDQRNPIFNRGTTLSLSTQITLDQLYNDLAGGDKSSTALPGQPF